MQNEALHRFGKGQTIDVYLYSLAEYEKAA